MTHHKYTTTALFILPILIIFFSVTILMAQNYTLSGRVYSGNEGQEPAAGATALESVTVKLWGANNSGVPYIADGPIDQTSTSSDGWYSLSVDLGDYYAFEYFIIEEVDKSGYYSTGATSVGGTKISNNYIQYTVTNLTDGTRTGNKFWDKPVVVTAPEIDVRGNNISIPDGDTTPRTEDGTDMGSVVINTVPTSTSSTFYIHNTGTSILSITGLSLNPDTYAYAASFGLIPSSATVSPGDSVSLGVECSMTNAGTYTTELSINNNDSDENPYTITIKVTGTAAQVQDKDYGDAPSPYPDASHKLNGPYFSTFYNSTNGAAPDAESAMQRSNSADGDDNDGNDDEATFEIKLHPSDPSIPYVASDYTWNANGYTIGVWIDWNRDSDWDDTGEEYILNNSTQGSGSSWWWINYSNLPALNPGPSYARIRIVEGNNVTLTADGDFGPGEVEDHAVTIPQIDQPDPEKGVITGRKWDDANGDGIIQISEPYLSGWTIYIDSNDNGQYDSGEPSQVTDGSGFYLFSGLAAGTYSVGEINQAGYTQTYPGGSGLHSVTVNPSAIFTLNHDFGNKENVSQNDERDYGDAPAPYPSASHLLGGPYFVESGAPNKGIPDSESSMQRHNEALGDDNNGSDDEMILQTPYEYSYFVQNQSLNISWYYGTGKFTYKAWIDWNQDGDFDDQGENIITNSQDYTGYFPFYGKTHYLNFPNDAKNGKTILRIRIVDGLNVDLQPDGNAGKGEVEDYQIEINKDSYQKPDNGIIYGFKWNDINGNRLPDIGESGLANWTIYLDSNSNGVFDMGESNTLTDSNGYFQFNNVSPGTYTVAEHMQSGWKQTWPGGSGSYTISVSASGPFSALYFGNQQDDTENLGGGIKWPQPPLFHYIEEQDTFLYQGWKESSSSFMPMVADDWFCYDPRPVTAIRWWGAYADWDTTTIPQNAPDEFHIGVWTDVPRDEENEWSHPGQLIHEWMVSRNDIPETPVRGIQLSHYQEEIITGFQYTYNIPNTEWFYQEGDSTVYWLSITAMYTDFPDTNAWGWLTREHHFMDDAVRMHFDEMPGIDATNEHSEPIEYRWDQAFILATEEDAGEFDFGDAPQTGYNTLQVNNGPYHRVVPDVYMGEKLDEEEDGLPETYALGDDQTDEADEDGVQFTESLFAGQENEVIVEVSSSGFLNAWLDVHGDGNWYEHEDHVLEEIEMTPGEHTLHFHVPGDAVSGETAFRFRFSRQQNVWFNGFAMDGEVEDYMITIQTDTDVERTQMAIPSEFMLYSNYPNPFNPSTQISYSLPEEGYVILEIYNIRGKRIKTLTNQRMEAGNHTITWDGTDNTGSLTSSGLYFCRMNTESYQKTIRMLFLK